MCSSVRCVLTNLKDQRLRELSLLHISSTFLNILAVVLFALLQHWVVFLAFQSTHQILWWHFQRLLAITTGTTSTILSFHNLPISLFKSSYFPLFSLSFSPTVTPAGTAMSMIILFRSFLSITITSSSPTHSSYRNSRWTSLLHCHVVSYILSMSISRILILSVARFYIVVIIIIIIIITIVVIMNVVIENECH